jgi:hypothetical protein
MRMIATIRIAIQKRPGPPPSLVINLSILIIFNLLSIRELSAATRCVCTGFQKNASEAGRSTEAQALSNLAVSLEKAGTTFTSLAQLNL